MDEPTLIALAHDYRQLHAETNDPVLLVAARNLETAATGGGWQSLAEVAGRLVGRLKR